MALDTIGSIATFIVESFTGLPAGVSGNMVEIVDMARQHVENYVGTDIGSNSIAAQFQPPIVSFSKADALDMAGAQAAGENIKLAELSVGEVGETMSATQWRMMGENALYAIGRKHRFSRSVS